MASTDNIGKKQSTAHTLSLSGRETLSLTGISDVISFDENGLLLQTDDGTLTVDGSDIHIVALSVETGELLVQGRICGLYYVDRNAKKSGFFKKRDP
ncbi:MAG: sporulation protein [Ruminococcaceae bacterium]|nr:sporulation protein [Oscillospiraceae bacterium]